MNLKTSNITLGFGIQLGRKTGEPKKITESGVREKTNEFEY